MADFFIVDHRSCAFKTLEKELNELNELKVEPKLFINFESDNAHNVKWLNNDERIKYRRELFNINANNT